MQARPDAPTVSDSLSQCAQLSLQPSTVCGRGEGAGHGLMPIKLPTHCKQFECLCRSINVSVAQVMG